MKQVLIALALMLTLNASAETGVQPRHRHHARTEQLVADTTKQQAAAVDGSQEDATGEGIEAYSDTTSTSTAQKDSIVNLDDMDDDWDHEVPNNSFDRFVESIITGTAGAGAIFLAFVVLIILLFVCLAPFIFVILLIRLLVKNHNNKVRLAEKAMETGQPIPEEVKPAQSESADYYWRRGVRHVALGIGLALMFWFMKNGAQLCGVGLLVACYGAGQVYISKKTNRQE